MKYLFGDTSWEEERKQIVDAFGSDNTNSDGWIDSTLTNKLLILIQ